MVKKDIAAFLQQVLDSTDKANVPIWIYGGWGLDALEGHQLREHHDVDLFVRTTDAPALKSILLNLGCHLDEGGPNNFGIYQGPHIGDVLLFDPHPDGYYITDAGAAGAFTLPPDSFPDEPNATLFDRAVRVVSYKTQYVMKASGNFQDRAGLTPKHLQDLDLIRRRLGEAQICDLAQYLPPVRLPHRSSREH